MTQTELNEVLKSHALWFDNKLAANAKRANLNHKDLSGMDLSNANLSYAHLSNAKLSYANLTGANLSGANLTCANLSNANLRGVDLRSADLRGANLSGANLTCVDLRSASLSYAHLYNANLTDAILPDFQLCPQNEPFEAYKKVLGSGRFGGVVLKLRIEGPRTSSLVGRKCRTSKAFVVEAYGSEAKEFQSLYDSNFVYRVGEYVEVSNYDPDIRVECTSGIHFFMTREEANDY